MRACLILVFATCLSAADYAWNLDAAPTAAPDVPLSGAVYGVDMANATVSFDGKILKIESAGKTGGWPAAKLTIFLQGDGQTREYVVDQGMSGSIPHIHMNVVVPGRRLPGTLMYTGMYCMRLDIDDMTDGVLSGRIALSLPDWQKSVVFGRFSTTVE